MMNNGTMLATNNISDNITFNHNISSSYDFFAGGSTTGIAMLSIISVTTVLAIAYSILIVIRPAFRKNKLNWFTVNVCLASAWFSITMIVISIPELFNVSSYLSCRIQVPSSVLQGVIALISTNQPVRTFLIESVTKRRHQV
ncbi:unnamed protein product [Adineta steineri]|uniref:Uncharacterized protein n=2 Tax=Adineta steineri TaxID=433720 RepID=A0A814C542_9BILA|nr:unnamed protein product [Adineta steineri]